MNNLSVTVPDLVFWGPIRCLFFFYSGLMAACLICLITRGKEMSDMQRCITQLRGYRSRMSKKNLDTWNFAQDYSIIGYMKVSTIEILALIPVLYILQIKDILYLDNVYAIIFLSEAILPVIIVRILTEKALRKNFNNDGTKINL